MRIAISGVTGFRNRGVEALVEPIVGGLRRVFPACHVSLFTGSPDYDRRRACAADLEIVQEGQLYPSLGLVKRGLRRLGFATGRGRYAGWAALEVADLLVVTGGDVFSSEYGDASFDRHLVPLRVASRFGVPYYLFAQSIGPFNCEAHRRAWLPLGLAAAGISARESRTKDYLVSELGIPPEKVSLVADPAFLLSPDHAATKAVSSEWNMGKPRIGLALSESISHWSGVSRESRIRTWVTVCQRALIEWNAALILIPHVQESFGNDTVVCTEVWRRCGFPEAMRVQGEDLSAAEYKAILSTCDLVIAERMHAGIGALSCGVSTSIVAYSVKARGIMGQMVGADAAAAGAVLEGKDFNDAELVWERIIWVWRNRAEIGAALARGNEEIRGEAEKAFDLLPAAIGSNSGGGGKS